MMIRKLQNADMDRVAGIWLDANLRAHCFISPQYWKSNFDPVKEMLPRAEVYVYENDREIWGFIGLNGEYIEGIFVSGEIQSRGIGTSYAGKSLFLIKEANSLSSAKLRRLLAVCRLKQRR